MSKTTLFYNNLTANNNGIIAKRAELIFKQGESAARKQLEALKDELSEFELREMNLEDLSPETTVSLLPAEGKFEGTEWFKQLSEIAIKKDILTRKIEIIQKLYDKYFTVEKDV